MSSVSRRMFLASCAALVGNACLSREGNGADAGLGLPEETLRREAQRRGIKIGAAVSSEQLLKDVEFRNAVLRDCALLVPEWELKWTTVRKTPVPADFSGMDSIAKFARENGLALRGHPLVWHGAMPEWAIGEIAAGGAERLLENHVRMTVGRYAGRILSWDVVNEAIKPEDGVSGGLRDTPWFRAMGPEYIEKAFRLAATMDPSARLVYNDYNIEYEEPKARAIVSLIKKLKDKDVPIHAVGLQSHLWATKRKLNLAVLRDFCRSISREGLEIVITEFDVRESDFDSSIQERDRKIASVADSYLDTVFAECIPKELVLWGLSDRYSWLSKPKFNPENQAGHLNRGLPYDTTMVRKQLWHVLMEKIRSVPLSGKRL